MRLKHNGELASISDFLRKTIQHPRKLQQFRHTGDIEMRKLSSVPGYSIFPTQLGPDHTLFRDVFPVERPDGGWKEPHPTPSAGFEAMRQFNSLGAQND